MRDYLVFRLYGPMASWGEIAVGETRHSAPYPSRSALLGLLGAALGITRDDDAGQARLAGYRFGVKLHGDGFPMRDYHTVQSGPRLKRFVYRTRCQELTLPARHQLNTLLTAREYRCDSVVTVAVATDGEAPTLTELAAALKCPAFPLYLGRKSCPPAAPLAPHVGHFDTLKAALDHFDDVLFPELGPREAAARRALKHGRQAARYYWDQAWGADGLSPELPATLRLTRHDAPSSRRRWQFAPRHEYMAMGAMP